VQARQVWKNEQKGTQTSNKESGRCEAGREIKCVVNERTSNEHKERDREKESERMRGREKESERMSE